MKRKTSKKKFAKKCREVNLLLVKMRTCRLKEIIAKLNQILTGYYHYYGITDNTESITAFRYNIMRSLFYCLNRRSQKKSYNWVEFLNMLDNSYPLVRPRNNQRLSTELLGLTMFMATQTSLVAKHQAMDGTNTKQ